MKLAEALARLRHTPEFKEVIEAAEKERPFLRPLKPEVDLNKQANRMLFDQGRQDGFDMLMNFLRGNDEWQSRNK